MSNTTELQKKIGDKWSQYYSQSHKARTRWWQSPFIIRFINEKIAGKPLEGFSQGLINRAMQLADDRYPFHRGISVGCGNASKEINLIVQGLVASFTLFDLSQVSIEKGKESARKAGVEDKVNFILGDAFETLIVKEWFDFVHWNNSLHHMHNVEEAVRWSYSVCKKGGMFFMDDFVGPNRFQWSEKMLAIASMVRSCLPERYLVKPPGSLKEHFKKMMGRKAFFARRLERPNIQNMILNDPSEAPDSERIIQSVKKYFPNAEITLTGGVIYHHALNDILQNFDEEKDKWVLDLFMIIDDLCTDLGETHYATALAIK